MQDDGENDDDVVRRGGPVTWTTPATMPSIEWWRMRTPLGLPVEPDVYIMTAIELGLGLVQGNLVSFCLPSSMTC